MPLEGGVAVEEIMGLVVVPVVRGKEALWANTMEELGTTKKAEWQDFNRRYGLTRHDVWAAQTPHGLVAVVVTEGPGEKTYLQKLASAEEPFDVQLRERIEEVHGFETAKPLPGSPPELKLTL